MGEEDRRRGRIVSIAATIIAIVIVSVVLACEIAERRYLPK